MSWHTSLIFKLNFNASEEINVTILNLYQIIFLGREIHRLTVRNWEGKKCRHFPVSWEDSESKKKTFCKIFFVLFI